MNYLSIFLLPSRSSNTPLYPKVLWAKERAHDMLPTPSRTQMRVQIENNGRVRSQNTLPSS